jgi:hypothetical protein
MSGSAFCGARGPIRPNHLWQRGPAPQRHPRPAQGRRGARARNPRRARSDSNGRERRACRLRRRAGRCVCGHAGRPPADPAHLRACVPTLRTLAWAAGRPEDMTAATVARYPAGQEVLAAPTPGVLAGRSKHVASAGQRPMASWPCRRNLLGAMRRQSGSRLRREGHDVGEPPDRWIPRKSLRGDLGPKRSSRCVTSQNRTR